MNTKKGSRYAVSWTGFSCEAMCSKLEPQVQVHMPQPLIPGSKVLRHQTDWVRTAMSPTEENRVPLGSLGYLFEMGQLKTKCISDQKGSRSNDVFSVDGWSPEISACHSSPARRCKTLSSWMVIHYPTHIH